jgi:PAS domain S-box-containing protein
LSGSDKGAIWTRTAESSKQDAQEGRNIEWPVHMAGNVRANLNSLGAPVDDAQFRTLAENIPTLCWIADAEGYIVWYNSRWYDYTGTTPSQMEGWGWQSVHDPKTLPEVLERWSAAISSGQPFEMVFPIRGADGIFRPFLTRINPAFGDGGAVTGWYGVNTDISPQIEAEDAFIKSEARFRMLADSMPQMVWSALPGGFLDYYNARWYDYTGLPIGSTDGNGWTESVHPQDLDTAWTTWRRSVESGAPYHVEYRLRHRSGKYKWVLARAQAERDAQGNIARWYGTWTDIEEIVQARTILQRSRDELEAEVASRTGERNLLARIVETTDVMIMAIDMNYTILALNKANADEFERVYGVRPQVGDNVLALVEDQPEQHKALKAGWARAIAGEEMTIAERRGDKARVRGDYEIKFRTLKNAAGEQIGAFQFVTDITEKLRDQERLAQAQEALLQSQKLEAMGQLTGGVAHDFNNLLTPIIGGLDMLQRPGIDATRKERMIHGAAQSAERAKILVQRLLAFARRQPLQSTPTDIGALLHGLAGLIGSTAGPRVVLTMDVAGNLPAAKADPNQLEMAILNLSANARDAMDGIGHIRISATAETIEEDHKTDLKPGNYVRLCITDTGRGMDEATRVRAIEPFFSTKGIGKGTGLGLSMAHGLALQLGGRLTIESQPGVGTEISIWLPESGEAPAPYMETSRNEAASLDGGTALVVDDEDFIRISIAEMLTDLGFDVREAASAEAALSAIEAGLKPDLLITDHLMPGMTGVELAYAVKAWRPNVDILIVSGFAEVEGIDPALPRLTKPFVQSDLIDALVSLRA